MKTTVIENNKTGEKLSGSAVNNKADNKGEQPKTNGLPISTAFADKTKGETEPKKAETAKTADLPKTEATKVENPQPQTPKPDAPKAETEKAKEMVQEKHILNLESTLKLVEELYRRKMQRDRLLDTIDTLDAFEVAQIDNADETEANHFQGCVLTIEDDNRRKFSTKNPVIIQAVAQFVNTMCINRLAEIEAGIIIPA
ncbi:type IV secretory pathway VirB10-like protein [Pedobacter sp. CG_S7]|uniref:hypothetical protein n=1 Tax=Pedobacter sp. CG_S7 TaxID=3143930 RepID=UPI003398A455